MELKSEPPKYAFTQHFVVFVYVFEHLDFEMKSGVELKLIFKNPNVILCIYDNFHCFCAIGPC
jgi:hypothetical protein